MDPNKGMKRKYSSNMSISKSTSCSTTGTDSSAILVSKEFPEGLRVLAVDDSSTCLQLLERMLQACGYEVTKCRRAKDALSILRENKNKFDIVISAVHIPDMDGFRLLDIIRLEMDLPVVMVSSDEKKDVVMENIINGACDYLVKPVRMEAIKFIWQHVVRKQRNSLKASLQLQSKKGEDGEMNHKQSINDEDYASSSGDKENCGSSNIRKYDQEEEAKDRDDAVSLKKQRMVWTTELHQQFMAAVNQIGLKNAVPKKILELMNVSGLTRENVASHLQKYRIYLQRQNSNLQHLHSQELNLKLTSSLDNCNQLRGSSRGRGHATTPSKLQQTGVESSHSIYSSSGMALVDHQRNFVNYGLIPESRFEIEQHQQQRNNCNLQVNFPHQVSTMIDSEQQLKPSSNQSVKLFGNMDVRMKDGGAPYSLNLPTLRISPVADINHGNPSSPLMVQMIAGDGSTIDYAVPLSSMINDFPKGHVIKFPEHEHEHDFCLDTDTSANVSFVGNKNFEFTSYSSCYEPTLFIERFDQDDLNLRPFDEQWIGYVEAKSSFNGYLTDNNSA